jgi:PAP2 superfamily
MTPVVAVFLHWIPWTQTLPVAILSAAAAYVARRFRHNAAGVLRELAIILALYSLWGFAGEHADLHMTGAFDRGKLVWHAERFLPLPTELTVQHWALHSTLFVRFLNVYYAVAHVPALIAFLIWLFAWHRPQYPRVRNTIAILTGSCLLMHLVPVAPPRLMPGLGFIDTAARYGPTVYPKLGQSGPDQFSALPSVHVAWASVIAISVVAVSRSRWRWIGPAHLVLTFLAVVATGMHWWIDGLAAWVVLAFAFGVEAAGRGLVDRVRIAWSRDVADPAVEAVT